MLKNVLFFSLVNSAIKQLFKYIKDEAVSFLFHNTETIQAMAIAKIHPFIHEIKQHTL
jgi:hypothetical protein